MRRFNQIIATMTDGQILTLFESSKSLTDFCRKVRYQDGGEPAAIVIKAARSLAERVGFDIENYHASRKAYDANPPTCKHCGKVLSWNDVKARKAFCDSSCSASFNNMRRERKAAVKREKAKTRVLKKSHPSILKEKGDDAFELWKTGASSPEFSSQGLIEGEIKPSLKRRIKEFLLEEQKHKCKLCGCLDVWNNQNLMFILDHIDGDWSNQIRSNFRLVCPNCNSQLETTKNKQRGTGRLSRRLDWHKYADQITQG